ncbi:MAG: methylated-DNA--[protein]-cysteine S-methyltransferase [Planctomycetota bacterium]|nr:methylated-DNA--[protein]-cysteine S-methyltransferase [Planctomycetota bacterium]
MSFEKDPPSRYRVVENPLRRFVLLETESGRLRTMWPDSVEWQTLEKRKPDSSWHEDLAQRLTRYFEGDVVDFSDVPTPEGPDFFHNCWAACRTIARGQTCSYGELARLAWTSSEGRDESDGRNSGGQAAGQAMRRNPLPIIVPCHRVLASTGRLHGFSGSSDPQGENLYLKRTLLEMEGALTPIGEDTLFDH